MIVAVLIILLITILYVEFYKKKDISYEESDSNTRASSAISQPTTINSGSNYQKPVYGQAVEKDYENLEDILKNNEMILALPDDAKLLLAFYNFNTGERTWEKFYTITKGNAEQKTSSDYDIRLNLHSKYLTVLNQDNLCSVIQTANNNGDFGSETELSSFSLGWKFKSMLKYRDCLGF